MDSFFFIPANKLKNIGKIKQLGIHQIIIDFEDAISSLEDRDTLLDSISLLDDISDYWYRIPIRNIFTQPPDFDFLIKVLNKDCNKIIVPKLKSHSEIRHLCQVLSQYKELNIILLIEHPQLLLELPDALKDLDCNKLIMGLGVGLEDMIGELGSIYDENLISYIRNGVFINARAYNKICIDTASMNITNKDAFEADLKDGAALGYDAKFLIHPKQHEWMEAYKNNDQLTWAQSIIESLPEGLNTNSEIQPFVLNGKVIEKPHVIKAKKIIKKYGK